MADEPDRYIWLRFPLDNGGVLEMSVPRHLSKKDNRRFKKWFALTMEPMVEPMVVIPMPPMSEQPAPGAGEP